MTKTQKNKETKRIESEITRLGYEIDYSDNSDRSWITLKKVKETKVNEAWDDEISFNWMKDALPTCCGVIEAGNTESEYYYTDKKLIRLMLKLFLILEHPEDTVTRSKVKRVKPLIFVGNGIGEWKDLEEVLKELPTLYYHVTTTKNPGSGNTLKTYVSI